MHIRDAHESDLIAILEIYNQVIATSTAVYREEPATLDDQREWWQARSAQGYPILVAVDLHGVLGFASFGDFRPWPCYRCTVEHSIHVRDDRRGHGVGTALMGELLHRASILRKHVMIGGVDAENDRSLRFHERLGFVRVAHFKEVGFKFGRWLDLYFVQRTLETLETDSDAS
jgi:phosphinothricin acetyltransferase